MFELFGVKFFDWISHLNRFCFVIAHLHFDNVISNYCQSSRFVEVRLLWSPAVGVVTLEGGQSDGDTMFPSNRSLLEETPRTYEFCHPTKTPTHETLADGIA